MQPLLMHEFSTVPLTHDSVFPSHPLLLAWMKPNKLNNKQQQCNQCQNPLSVSMRRMLYRWMSYYKMLGFVQPSEVKIKSEKHKSWKNPPNFIAYKKNSSLQFACLLHGHTCDTKRCSSNKVLSTLSPSLIILHGSRVRQRMQHQSILSPLL